MKKLLLFIPLLLYGFVVQDDEKYFVHQTPYATIIYTKAHKDEAKKTLNSYRVISNYYNESYRYTPRSKPQIVVASRQNQIANAWSTAIPYPQMTIYGGGVQELDYFGFDSWIDVIVAHEASHIYQLDSKESLSQKLEMVFGHNYMPIFVPIPLFTKPNLFTPDLLLEGNALYNESKITRSGRMYGGRHKALVMALAKSGKLNAKRLINNHEDFPYLEEKYIVGGYFQAFLENGNLDSYFMTSADHYINPLLLDRGFKEHYGDGFYKKLDLFIEDLSIRSSSFVLQSGKEITLSKAYAPFGSNEKNILIFSSDMEQDTRIIKIDKNSKKVEIEKGEWFIGKPFCFDSKCYTVSSGYTAKNRIETGLFDKYQKPLKEFNGKVLQDIYDNNQIYIDTTVSFDKAKLFENDRYLGEIASFAKYGSDGTIYTIKKNGDRYTLFAGSTPLFSLRSHFLVADIDSKNRVLFVANSPLGSALYLYDGKEIKRALSGDNILDARWFSDRSVIVNSVTADGYKTLLTALEISNEKPAREQLAFEKTEQLDLIRSDGLELQEKPYNSLKMLKFSNLYPFVYITNDGLEGSLDINFVDPLNYNMVNMGYIHEDKAYAYGGYHNQKYNAYFGATYYAELNGTRSEIERDYGADLYIGYKVLKTNTKELDLIARQIHDPDNKNNTPNLGILSYKYGIKKPMEYKANRLVSLDLIYKENSKIKDETAYGYRAEIGARVFGQTYLDLINKYSSSENGYLKVSEAKAIKDPLNFELINMPITYLTRDVNSYKGTLTTAFKTPIYFEAIPLGLHRTAPKISYEQLDLAKGKYTIDETVFALEAKMLFAHRFDFDIELGVASNSEAKDDKFYFMLKVE